MRADPHRPLPFGERSYNRLLVALLKVGNTSGAQHVRWLQEQHVSASQAAAAAGYGDGSNSGGDVDDDDGVMQ
jgi:hypothetical protein